MEGSYRGNLNGNGWASAAVADSLADGNGCILPGPHNPSEFARASTPAKPSARRPAQRGQLKPRSRTHCNGSSTLSPSSHGHEGRWIPRLLEFAKHSGETLLGLGNGLGTDWLQYRDTGLT